MEKVDSKDELINLLLYQSNFTGDVCVGLHGDALVSDLMTDELESEVLEVLDNAE